MAAILGSIGFAILPGLMCAGAMLLCMRMMFRGSRSGADSTDKSGVDAPDTPAKDQGARIAALEAEVARLRANQDYSRQPHP